MSQRRLLPSASVLILMLVTGEPVAGDLRVVERVSIRPGGGTPQGSRAGQNDKSPASVAPDELITTTILDSSRRMVRAGQYGRIVDLPDKKIYDIDFRARTFIVSSVGSKSQAHLAARSRLATVTNRSSAMVTSQSFGLPGLDRRLIVKVTTIDSGVTERRVAGRPTRLAVLTATGNHEGTSPEEDQRFVLTFKVWLAVDGPSLGPLAAFEHAYRRLAAFRRGPLERSKTQRGLFSELEERLSSELEHLGVPLAVETTFEVITGGRIVSLLANVDGVKPSRRGPSGVSFPKSASTERRRTVFTSSREVVSISTTVSPADVRVPKGFARRGAR